MITLRKLASLPDGTRHRKIPLLLGEFERALKRGVVTDGDYLTGLAALMAADPFWPDPVRAAAAGIADRPAELVPSVRDLNTLRHMAIAALGQDWADWDLRGPGDGNLVTGERRNQADINRPRRVYLDGIRSPFNVGSVMRTAFAFGMERVWCAPGGALPSHPRCRRSAMGAVDALPWEVLELDELDDDRTGTVFALELGGTNLEDFAFPDSGTVILGSEELGVSPGALRRAGMDGGIVSIRLPGAKASLNVGVAFGILASEWRRQVLSA